MKDSWLDRAPVPTGVLRGANVVYANQALLDLLGVSREELVGRVFLDHVAPDDRERLRDRNERRARREPVPDDYEFELLRADGSHLSVEVWVAAARVADGGADGGPAGGPAGDERVEFIFQLADRTSRARDQDKLATLAQIGVSVQLEQTEEAVFAAISRGLTGLGMAMARLAPADEGGSPDVEARILSLSAPGDLAERFHAAAGRPMNELGGVWGPSALLAWCEGGAYIDDMPLALTRFFVNDYVAPSQAASALSRSGQLGRGVMIRIDVSSRPVELLLMMADWLLPEHLPACRLFGAQISAALDAARAIRELWARNATLAAQNRIASVARAAGGLDVLFHRACEELTAVLGCDAVAIYLVDDAVGEASLVHAHGASEEARRAPTRVSLATTNIGVVARGGAPRVFRRDDYDEGRRALLDRLGQRVVISVPLVTRGNVIGVMDAAFREERAVLPREVELMEATGAHFAAAVEAQGLFSDLRRSYADLARAQEQLVQRERLAAIGELAAVVAHEVRNPLGVLFNSLGAFRKLLGPGVEGSARTLLEIMEEESARLNHIVGDLLDFARPTAPTLHRERLAAVLEEAVDAALGEHREHIRVARQIAELPLVPMDARLIRQALLNLAVNAVQAMPEGGTITLRVGRDEPFGQPMACVAIEDTGGGIAPEVESRIFEPFFTTRATGTGLGLAVVKRIVDSHHGHLRVSTVEGYGATFTLWLPLGEGLVEAAGAADEPLETADAILAAARGVSPSPALRPRAKPRS